MKPHWPLLVLGIGSLLGPVHPGAAQGVLLDARVQVTLSSPGRPVDVRAAFKILPQAGAEEIPLSLLAPEHSSIQALRALLSEGASDPFQVEAPDLPRAGDAGFHLEEIRDHFSEGSIRLATHAGPGGDTLFLHLSYTVEGAWTDGGRITLPLVVPRWAPVEPTPRTFLAHVGTPQGYTIIGSFPTSVLNRPPPGSAGTYEIGLQGVPSMLILQVVQGKGTFITLERGLDLFVVLILLVMGVFGVRYLKRRER